MATITKYADVVVGKTTTRYTVDDGFVKDIKIDPQTMALVIFMKDGNINTFFGCPYVICQHDDGLDIVLAGEMPTVIAEAS